MRRHPRRIRRAFVVAATLGVFAAACSADESSPPDEQAPEDSVDPAPSASPDDDEAAEENPEPEPAPPDTHAAPSNDSIEPLPFHVEGHRGARGLKPENTLPAFEAALDIGVSTLELDLHLSADDQVVVWHDNALGAAHCRFADDTDYPGDGVPVVSLTAAQLADYRCDLNPDSGRFPDQNNDPTAVAGSNYQPVTLGEVFAFVADYADSADKTEEQRARAAAVEFNIETKRDLADPAAIGDNFDGVSPGQFEQAVLAAIDDAGMSARTVIQSFDHRSLWAVRSVDPDIRLAALTVIEPPDLQGYAAQGADIWSPNFNVLTADLVEDAHTAGLLVIPWTVNEADAMTAVLDQGVDGFITDRPDIAASLR